MSLSGSASDRLRAGTIAADPLASRAPGDDCRPIHTPHDGAQLGRRWAETPLEILYVRN